MSGRRAFVRACFAILTALTFVSSAAAQPGGPPPGQRIKVEERPIPSPRYYSGVTLIERGTFAQAVLFYQREARDSIKIGANRWIDCIPPYAMIGEAYYQAGNLDESLKWFNAALSLAMEYPDWLARVSYTGVPSSVSKTPAPWGGSRRMNPLGNFPAKATIVIGDEITDQRLKASGVTSDRRAFPIDPFEIIRCTALAIRRRIEIIGPLAPYDPMSEQIYSTFQKRATSPNHWSTAWLDVVWGLALQQLDKTPAAVKTLTGALTTSGDCDHSLTGVALFELGNIFLRSNKPAQAAECYYEASVSAYHFGDNLLAEEALRNYSNAIKAVRHDLGVNPVIDAARVWARGERNQTLLQVSLGLELVEDYIYAGRSDVADKGLTAMERQMTAEMRRSRLADRWNYLRALQAYSTGHTKQGDDMLALVVEGCRARSTWARHLRKLDDYVQKGLTVNGSVTERNAADLYAELLREPTVVDWAARPIESLAIQMLAPISAYERQFCLLVDRGLFDDAFEVAERIRRERFYSTQTYGGRLVSLRYIMTVDDALTTASLRSARDAILTQYPDFLRTREEAAEIMSRLNSLPVVPSNADENAAAVDLYMKLAEVSNRQEAMLRFIAAGRIRIPYVYPPVYSVADVQARLPEETAILSFLEAQGDVYGFMIGDQSFDLWRIGPSEPLRTVVANFLRMLGNHDGTREVKASELAEARWKAQGDKLRQVLLGANDADADRFNIVFSKLVVVPDSFLWYLPFEALCLPKATEEEDDDQEEEVAQHDADAEDVDEELGELAELDAAYQVDPEEVQDDAQDKPEQEDSAQAQASDATPQEDATPARRPSRNARREAALDAYEAALMPMIQAQDFTIRYSAATSLALPNALGRNAFVDTAVITEPVYPRQTSEASQQAFARLSGVVKKTIATDEKRLDRTPSAYYAARLQRLVVWKEIVGNTWNWSPFAPAKSRGMNSVNSWIASPWGAPRLMVMPALRTHAEDSLKDGGDGSELFLPVLAMQASGADTMLLSRWRTGGRSMFDLTQEFLKNYPEMPVAEAWKQAVTSVSARDVVVEEEPRLRKLGRSEPTPRYDSPFWWAGYLLIDSGEPTQSSVLEELDQAAAQKAQEENALLEEGEVDDEAIGAQGERQTPEALPTGQSEEFEGEEQNAEPDDDQDSGVGVRPIITVEGASQEQEESSEDFLQTEEESLDDLDMEGDDFYADDEEPTAPSTTEPPKSEPKETPKVEPTPTKEQDDKEADSNVAKPTDKKNSAARISVKGKGTK
ncbi:MAG: hypothetical protein Q4G03_11985 [Planctomycetia bacterium]|nr:hypothetical protein [Planctomycetia bacterium]